MLCSRLMPFCYAMETRYVARQLGAASQMRLQPCARPVALSSVVTRRLLSARASRDDRPGPDKDKSWGEILGDAAGVAKSVFTKLKDTATSLLPAPPSTSAKPAKPAPSASPEAPLGPSFGGGGGLLPNLVGRALGGLLSSALSSLSAQLEEAAREQAGAYEEAVAQIQASTKLRSRLGTVNVGPVVSQSSSSSSINGVVSKQIGLLMPVYGSLGASATAQVNIVEGAQQPGGRSMQITVRTSDGGVIVVDDGGSGGSSGGRGGSGGRGAVIDVEFREIKK